MPGFLDKPTNYGEIQFMDIIQLYKQRLFNPGKSTEQAIHFGNDFHGMFIVVAGAIATNLLIKSNPRFPVDGPLAYRFFDEIVSATIFGLASYWFYTYILFWISNRIFGGHLVFANIRKIFGYSPWVPMSILMPLSLFLYFRTAGQPVAHNPIIDLMGLFYTVAMVWGVVIFLFSYSSLSNFSKLKSFWVLMLSSISFVPVMMLLFFIDGFLLR